MPMNPRTLRPSTAFNPRQISGLALWLDGADSSSLYTTDAGPGVAAVASPLDISGCVGWYDSLDLTAMAQNSDGTGAVSVGDQVGWWKDKSATAAHVTQGTAENRPTLTANQVNGLAALKFDGSNDNLSSANYTAQNSLSGLTRILILQNAAFAGGYVTRVWNGGGDGLYIQSSAIRQYVSADANYTAHATPSGTNALPLGIYSFRYGSSAMSLRADGGGLSGTVNGTIPATTGAGTPTLHIGSNIGANLFYNGVVAEYIIYNRELSAAELSRVEAYLAAKWGISNVHAPATSASQPVGYWGDKSGNGRHATQATAAARPSLSLAGRNGRNVVTASDTSRAIRTAAFPAGLPQTVFVVASVGAAGNQGVFQRGTVNGIHSLWNNAGTMRARRGSSSDASAVYASGYQLFTCTFTRTLSRLFVNGAQANDDTADLTGTAADSTDNRALTLFALDTILGMQGSISEFLYYNGDLAATDRRRIERYLATKWGITLAPQVSNADAQDWVNRVYANGGTVSSNTASAVNTFCNDIEAAGLRDRFYRLNLFAGTGLNAALVPLYRGTSRTGTQYGNTTDTNIGPFVSGDYAETGASGGLTGNGTSKYLNTGLAPDDYLSNANTGHVSVYHSTPTGTSVNRALIGANNSGNSRRFYIASDIFSSSAVSAFLGSTAGASQSGLGSQTGAPAGHRVLSRTGATSLAHYLNAASLTTTSTDITTVNEVIASEYFVSARNNNGAAEWLNNGRVLAYSIGDGLTAQQVTDFYTAMQAFQTALSRNL